MSHLLRFQAAETSKRYGKRSSTNDWSVILIVILDVIPNAEFGDIPAFGSDNHHMDEFHYTTLDPNTCSFRLLRLLKGHSIEVHCEIFHAAIDGPDAISYEALSYTWGSEELVNPVRVNGKELWITENLHVALQCLRSRDMDRILWVDAICIDQFNEAERSQQVQKMGTIFESADRVIFWLGKPTLEVVHLMQCLSELRSKSDGLRQQGLDTDKMDWKTLWSEIQRGPKSRDPHLISGQRKGLQVLLKRSWFRRVWILQEVAKARSAIVCSGRMSIPARIFALAPSLLNEPTELHVQSVLDIIPGPARTRSWWSEHPDLFSLVTKFHDCEATDMRDMIFALRGISSDSFDHALLRANYEKSVPEVLHDTIRYWFEVASTTVRDVVEVLGRWKTIQTTYLISFPFSLRKVVLEDKTKEIVQEVLARVGDASFIQVEQCREGDLIDKNTCHAELDQLESIMHQKRGIKELYDYRAITIVPWKGPAQNVKFVIIHHEHAALRIAATHECPRLLDLIVSGLTKYSQEKLDELLYTACATNQASSHLIKFLLAKGAKAPLTGASGDSMLRTLSTYGLVEMVRLLLDLGMDFNEYEELRRFYLAMSGGSHEEEIVRILTDRGVDVDASVAPYGVVLFLASECGWEKVAWMLLNKGADINLRGRDGRTALYYASANGHASIVQMLLNRGADIDEEHGSGTALQRASGVGNEELVRILLDGGANVNLSSRSYGTALKAATSSRHVKIVQMLLDNGADVNACGRFGTALRIASYMQHTEIVQILLERGAHPES